MMIHFYMSDQALGTRNALVLNVIYHTYTKNDAGVCTIAYFRGDI